MTSEEWIVPAATAGNRVFDADKSQGGPGGDMAVDEAHDVFLFRPDDGLLGSPIKSEDVLLAVGHKQGLLFVHEQRRHRAR